MTNASRLGLVPGQSFKAPVKAVSTSNLTLSGTQTVASVALAVNDRVLVAAQDDATENGIYNVKASTWARATDFNRAGDIVSGVQVVDRNTAGVYRVTFSGASWSPGVTELTVSDAWTFSGNVTMSGLPTSDPSSAGALWNDSGTLKVSAG